MKERIVDKVFIRYFLIVYYVYTMSIDVIIPKKSMLGIIMHALILLYLLYIIIAEGRNNKKFFLVYIYICYCFLLILLQSSDIMYSITNYIKYIIGILCLPVGFSLLSSLKKIREFQLTGIVCMLLYVLNVILANVFHWGNTRGGYSEEGLEVGNLFSDALYLNVYVIISAFFLVVLFPTNKKWILTLCAFCAILVVANMKRTVIGVLAVGIVMYLFLYYIKNGVNTKLSAMHVKILSIFVALSFVALPFFYNYIKINLEARQSSFERASEDIMNEGRMAEFIFISNEILNSDSPSILLFGKETFNLVGTYASGRFGNRQIHGDYSILMNGLGVVGLLIWLSFLLFLLIWLSRLKNEVNKEEGIIGSILHPLYYTFIVIYCLSMGSGVLMCVMSSSYFFASLGGILRYFYNRNIYLRVTKDKNVSLS